MTKRTQKLRKAADHANELSQALAIHRSVLATALCMFAPTDAKKVEDVTAAFVAVLGTCLTNGAQTATT